jgi:hypothetical protein
MIARGFKPVVWVAAVGTAALGCYMLSLRVASERADLTGLQRRIVATQQQIRALETEVGTRGRLAQLEQWNDEVLALAPPASGQFVQGAQLARFETHDAPPMDGAAEVQTASAVTLPAPAPAAPSAAPAMPAPQHAVAAAPAIQPQASLRQATVQRTSLTLPAPPAAAPARARPAAPSSPVRTASATPLHRASAPIRVASAAPRPATPAPVHAASPTPAHSAAHPPVPARTRTASAAPTPHGAAPTHRSSLLDDRTLRDLGAAARAERGGARD